MRLSLRKKIGRDKSLVCDSWPANGVSKDFICLDQNTAKKRDNEPAG